MITNKPPTLLQALFFRGLGHFNNWQRGSGTTMKRFRAPNEGDGTGNKLERLAAEHRLDGTSPGGIVSESFRNMAIQRNLARFANEVRDNNEPEPLPVAVVRQRVRGW